MSDRPPFAPLSLDALFALDLPEPEWIVPGLLPAGSATLFVGREKSGKSLMLLDLLCALAFEEPFLDRAVAPGAVLYLPAEDALALVRHRLGQRLDARRDGPLLVQSVTGETGARFRLDGGDAASAFEDLARLAGEHELRLIALDPLRELHEGQEDKSDDMAPLCRPLRQLAHATGAAVVVAHHMNRSGGSRGSTAIPASFDQVWSFTRTDDDGATPAGRLTVEGRYGPPVALRVRLGEGLRWELHEPAFVGAVGNVRDRIAAHLHAANGWRTSDQLAAELGEPKVTVKTVQNAIAGMLRERPAPLVSRGTGRRNDPRQYRHVEARLWPDDDGVDSPRTDPLRERRRGESTGGSPFGPNGSGSHGNHAEDGAPATAAGTWTEF